MTTPPTRAPERIAIEQGWFYVVETAKSATESADKVLQSRDGRPLTRRLHGYDAQVVVEDRSNGGLPVAAWLRAAEAIGRAAESAAAAGPTCLVLGPTGTQSQAQDGTISIDAGRVAQAHSHHHTRQAVAPLVQAVAASPYTPPTTAPLSPVKRVLAFSSLMSTDMPHNDKEISQGVLHLLAPLVDTDIEVVLAQVKMPIIGDERPPVGLEALGAEVLEGVDLVLLSLLEGYWHGAAALVKHLRAKGCRAHIAVGGVMPTLTPEHVAAHLPEVSFICRGAGEYFVPELAGILGGGSVDVPLTDSQVARLLGLKGLIAVDRAGQRLIAARPSQTVAVESLDSVQLDLSYLQPHHIEGGIEITTARGCIHRCTFCSIIGREQYQARSAEGVFALLRRYEDRYAELFGDHVPPNAYRVHIADDDFACDRPRARAFFEKMLDTPFRMSSVQVSVADLCRREDGRLLPEVDPAWLEVIRPECFADHGRDIPRHERIHDHSHRGWSSYLQIGVETFSDRELVRLGKGYRVAHLRAAVHALATHGLHHDAYFIVSNTQTTAWDLLDSVTELCRLKLRYPLHFHLRFPVVRHLVSYFPTATYRRKLRGGRTHSVELRDHLDVEGYPEFDYPLVDHDLPGDPWVAAAVDAGFLTDAERYTKCLTNLHDTWSTLPDGRDQLEQESLLRALDDRPRRLVFELLEDARRARHDRPTEGWPGGIPEDQALSTARSILGDSESWVAAYKRWSTLTAPRLVVIPTWQCELRCSYCYIPKQDGRVMTRSTLDRSIALLMSSDRPAVMLQFFGGEALLEWELVQQGITEGIRLAKVRGKQIQFVLSSNGWSLDADKLAWLHGKPVKLELSLDGTPETQNKFRHSKAPHGDSYADGIAPRVREIVESGLEYDVIMVVHPLNAHQAFDNFMHIAKLGFQRIQINVGLGKIWKKTQHSDFLQQLHRIGLALLERWRQGDDLLFINAERPPMPIRLNGEVTVDWDGTIYDGNAFLHETEHKQRFVAGHLDDAQSFDRYWLDGPTNEFLLEYSYPSDVTANNLAVGKSLRSFCLWLRDQAPDSAPLLDR